MRDLLEVPGVGRFLGWRHARTVLQAGMLALAAVVILDGLLGPSLAPRNLAGTLPWVHWRGFVVLALLVAGNLFCMACPFMLPRRLAKRFGPAAATWPAPLRSKWLAVGLLALFFWAYEAFSLWASPWLTAWVALTYFALAFAVDGFFRGAAFCKYVCPIGQFHFVNGMISPTEVRVRDPAVCERCTTLDCIRGRYGSDAPRPIRLDASDGLAHVLESEPAPSRAAPTGPAARTVPAQETVAAAQETVAAATTSAPGRALGRVGLLQGGCELGLFQPRKEGNADCTFCMECIHACPHDNVGIALRSPLRELPLDPVRSGVGRLSRSPDRAALALLLTFGAFVNAFGMTAPVHRLLDGAAAVVPIESPALLLAGFFVAGLLGVPAALTGAAAWASRALSGGGEPLLRRVTTYAWSLVPLGFAMWLAHYLFHLLVGGLTVVPVIQAYLADLGFPAGTPRWGAGALVPEGWLLPIEIACLQLGLLATLVVGFRIAQREEGEKARAVRAFLPWALLATLLALAGIWLLAQPMEMRGTFQA